MTRKNNLSFDLWFPNIFEFKGGIQVYSAVFLQALQELLPESNYQVFLKHDTQYLSDYQFLQKTNYYFAGNSPLSLRTAIFGAKIIGSKLKQRPSLIISGHVNFSPVAYWLKRLLGIPYWICVYGVDAWNIKRPALKTALHYADRIISIGSYTRDRLLTEQNLAPEKISILPCTFDVSRFQIAAKPPHLLKRYGLKPEQPVILTVARLDSSDIRSKGYEEILHALPQIRASIPNVHYLLVGKGSDRSRIEKFIAKLNLQDCVTLTGFVPDEELAQHYNLCDVFAMPSKGEGFGIVFLEALACGKPTLGGNQDGAIDALCHGELGVLVNPDNQEEIATNLVKILTENYPNSLLYQPEKLRQKVLETFGYEQFKQKLATLIDDFVMESLK
ncbi:MAG: glycosyltransferase [Oscillatoria sp. PMC 1068.18]|nr:glycosyltransferase [Oscillatoria sp. PMC 1068.18]